MDGDAFFVAVEVAKNPSLRGLPVVTGAERGIVSALSYEAKAIGIVRGMPIFRVKKDFPEVIILPGDYQSYAKYSSRMFDIVRRYADDVEEYSIDECFADLTGLEKPLKMTYKEIAERIKKEVNYELDLSVTIGIAPTKVLAKVATKWVKPNGLTIITQETIHSFLENVKIESVWGIGPRTALQLQKKGIVSAKDFVERPLLWVHTSFSKPYEVIWNELRGVSLMNVNSNRKTSYSSIQKTRTFHPSTNNKAFLRSQLSKNPEDACTKARHYSLAARRISFFIKDSDFKIHSHILTLPSPTNVPETLLMFIEESFEELYTKGVHYRATGVTLLELVSSSNTQDDLFGNAERAHKFEAIHKQIDTLEAKFGKKLVHLASTQTAINHRTEGTESEDTERNLLFL